MALLKNSLVVAVWTAVSRVLGFARDLIIANKLGAGTASDAFFIALQLPNLMRRLLGEGALNVAFVPLMAREQAISKEAAHHFAEAVMSWLFIVLSGITLVGMLLMPQLVSILMPGWVDDADKFALTVTLGRITFPYMMMICMAAFMGAVCNTAGNFAAYAMVPSLLNLAFISILFVAPQLGIDPVYAAAWSVPVGGIAQVGYMLWEMRRMGYALRLRWPTRHVQLKSLFVRMGPAVVGVGVLQLSLLIDNFVASWINGSAVSYLQYANRFYQFPLALIGFAVATVLLPHLSLLLGKGNKVAAAASFNSALLACVTIAVGAAVGLSFLAYPIVSVAFQHGAFTIDAAYATALAMAAYAVGLPAYILTKVTAPAFFANEDTATPVKASAISLVVNLVLNILFVVLARQYHAEQWAHIGIALSTAVGGYTNAFLQWHWLKKQGVFVADGTGIHGQWTAMATVMLGMMAPLMFLHAAWPFPDVAPLVWRAVWLLVGAGVVGIAFISLVEVTGLVNVRQLLTAALAKKAKTA